MTMRPTDLTKLHYMELGDIKAGFLCDNFKKPYLLAFVSFKGSPNLLETDMGRGMEFQSCILDGFIYPERPIPDGSPERDFWYDTTNPTHGGGNYGWAVPDVEILEQTATRLEVDLPAYDFMPNRGAMGAYKTKMLEGRYPDCGWRCTVVYQLYRDGIYMSNSYFMVDSERHHVYNYRPFVLHLHPDRFQFPLENEDKRDPLSFLQAVINDDEIRVKSIDQKIEVTITGGVDNEATNQYKGVKSYLSHRCFIEADREVQNTVGTGDVWESMCVIEPNRYYNHDVIFSGWGLMKIESLEPPEEEKPTYDYKTLFGKIFALLKSRRQRMKIYCDDGVRVVTDNEFAWLDITGKLVDMSSHPGPDGIGYFAGIMETLNTVLATMPAGWLPPVVEPPVVPPVVPPSGDFETQVLDIMVQIVDLLINIEGNTRK